MAKTETIETGLTPIQERLLAIQTELKAPKNRYNSFGKYNYRDAEGILEAVKPLLAKYNVLLLLSDDLEAVLDRVYVVATAQLQLGTASITINARAREEESKKGMDGSQVTGASSSYARKYALNGLFLIDDGEDSDSSNNGSEPEKKQSTAKPKEKAQETPAADKKTVTAGSKGFEQLAVWIAETEGATLDLLDVLKGKYNLTPEVETALAAKAAELREAKK